MPTQSEVTKRVREIYKELKSRGKVKFNRDFLGFTGLGDGTMSAILNENSTRPANLPIKYYGQVKKEWKITDQYWETGKGPMFEDEAEPTQENLLQELNENIKILIKEIRKLNAR